MNTELFGARAAILIHYAGTIQQLAIKLSSGLQVPLFRVEPRETPPYDMMGSSEALGCELWLEQMESSSSAEYLLCIRTAAAERAIFENRMYDLSPWLAGYVKSVCGIEAEPSRTGWDVKSGC